MTKTFPSVWKWAHWLHRHFKQHWVCISLTHSFKYGTFLSSFICMTFLKSKPYFWSSRYYRSQSDVSVSNIVFLLSTVHTDWIEQYKLNRKKYGMNKNGINQNFVTVVSIGFIIIGLIATFISVSNFFYFANENSH